ncbi:hypothetical protein NQZ68_036176 [Dissostichus eleginoides]|nr:hypothetical protein NQZ68_036176 [Dissostichus eleginoides]
MPQEFTTPCSIPPNLPLAISKNLYRHTVLKSNQPQRGMSGWICKDEGVLCRRWMECLQTDSPDQTPQRGPGDTLPRCHRAWTGLMAPHQKPAWPLWIQQEGEGEKTKGTKREQEEEVGKGEGRNDELSLA